MRGTYKIICVLIAAAFACVTVLAGCTDGSTLSKKEVLKRNQIAERIEAITDAEALAVSQTPFFEEFMKADATKKAEMAMELADDMAVAPAFDVMTPDMLLIAGEAVKAYPHPLLLNNYAGMLSKAGNAQDALFFYVEALAQEPDHPVILTNIANTYIELDNFEAAEEYAKKAIAVMDDYGPAYQVLTTVHLHNGNNELAAETMIKSARLGFNELTMHHFDSFIESVAYDLTPGADKYPLREEMLDELYTIARMNVDTMYVNEEVDTPDAQLQIKPFPVIGGADHLMKLQDYIMEEADKIFNKHQALARESFPLSNAYFDHIHEVSEQEGQYPILKNMRQIYALNLLDSYYTFKLNENYYAYTKKYTEFHDHYTDQESVLHNTYDLKINEEERLFDLTNDPAHLENALRLMHERDNEILKAYKQFAGSMISEAQSFYNASKQTLEEYWLKAGGLMKYLADEDIFRYYQAQRELKVLDAVHAPLLELSSISLEINVKYAQVAIYGELIEQFEQEKLSDLVPDLGEPILAIFPENDPFPEYTLPFTIGLEKGFFGFEASMSGNLDSYEFSVDTPLGAMVLQGSNSELDVLKAYMLYPVKAVGNTEWFKDEDVQKALAKTGKFGKSVGKLSKLGIGYVMSDRSGQYNVSKEGHGIIDRGTIHVKEDGWELFSFGKTEKTEVWKSQITGVVEIKKSTKYKFSFVSVQMDH